MERNLFRFIIQFSKRDQLLIVPLVLASMVVYYLSLDLPKTIINQAIQGVSFPSSDSVKHLFGFDLERIPYLFALSAAFLALIVAIGWLKFQINTMKGWMGERMLRRLRYALFDYILRFPLTRFRRVKAAEMATMVKDEVEPLGGFIGEALITPLFLGGQALTAMFFIVYQQVWLGLIALAIVLVRAVLTPRLRRPLLVLGRERQLTARALAGRIAECVDGAAEIHANDTSNYERAEISARLGRIFRIRFELYQRKFMVKFLNNFLSQVTPFLFYAVAGYSVIMGSLDIGALVAVIAAYKDLPTPVKELIDWDQQRLDVEIKYTQVVEQFTAEDVAPPELQAPMETPPLPRDGRLKLTGVTLFDEAGTRLVDEVSFDAPVNEPIAILGRQAGGSSELAQIIARLVAPSSGTIELGGMDLTRAPEALTGRALAYVGAPAYLFPASVRDNILYGLKHRPVRPPSYDEDAAAEREFQLHEAERTDNSTLDINAEWIDYQAAGVSTPEQMDERIVELLRVVDLEEIIFELGLRSPADSQRSPAIAERVLYARSRMHERLASLHIADWVERFDPASYNRNATLAENLLFGTPVGRTFDIDNLAANGYVRRVLHETGLYELLLRTGHKVAETMVQLFSGLPPGHELCGHYSSAASLQDTILFGKIVTGQAGATSRITALVRELLDELGLRPLVVKIGLDYQVGVGGARLAIADRQKTALVRALLKRPELLVVDQAVAPLDPTSQLRVLEGILAEREGKGVVWVLHRPELAERFSVVLVMERGRLTEHGRFEELKDNGGPLHKLLMAA